MLVGSEDKHMLMWFLKRLFEVSKGDQKLRTHSSCRPGPLKLRQFYSFVCCEKKKSQPLISAEVLSHPGLGLVSLGAERWATGLVGVLLGLRH